MNPGARANMRWTHSRSPPSMANCVSMLRTYNNGNPPSRGLREVARLYAGREKIEFEVDAVAGLAADEISGALPSGFVEAAFGEQAQASGISRVDVGGQAVLAHVFRIADEAQQSLGRKAISPKVSP